MSNYHHVAERFFNRPLALTPMAAEVVYNVIAARLGFEATAELPPYEGGRFTGKYNHQGLKLHDGVAVIPVEGKLVNRGAWRGKHSGVTSYEGISESVSIAGKNPDVSAIMLDINSTGGEVTGLFELTSQLKGLANGKPMWAFSDDYAASAAYAIASCADRFLITSSAQVGSIGVVAMHMDMSGALDKAGLKPTLIFAGDHKVDGNPLQALPENLKEEIQASVNASYEKFTALVAKNRSSLLSQEDVKETQARIYEGESAIQTKLADGISTYDAAIKALSRHAASAGSKKTPLPPKGKNSMINDDAAAHHAATEVVDKEALRREGANAVYSRLAEIHASDKLKDPSQFKAAMSLALKSPEMKASDVIAFVAENVVPQANAPSLLTRAADVNSIEGGQKLVVTPKSTAEIYNKLNGGK